MFFPEDYGPFARVNESKHSVHSQPALAFRRETVEQEDDAWNAYQYEHNVNSHSQFPFFLFVNTNPTTNVTNARIALMT